MGSSSSDSQASTATRCQSVTASAADQQYIVDSREPDRYVRLGISDRMAPFLRAAVCAGACRVTPTEAALLDLENKSETSY